jgi:SsrA-binding protein
MKILAKNSRAYFDYDFKDTFEAGLVLEGREVKSLREGNASMTGSFVSVDAHGATLKNCHIGPYKYAQNDDYSPLRERSLLLSKLEIAKILNREKGLQLIPLEIFQGRRSLLKLKFGLGKSRKKHDKREYIKTRDTAREIREVLS